MKIFKITMVLALFLFFSFSISAQSISDDGTHFLVEFEKFSPPVKEIINNFEGKPAEQFLANDITGIEHYLDNYKGKKVILWFWSKDNEMTMDHIHALNETASHHSDLVIISFARGAKSEVAEFAKTTEIKFPIIANADVFGQMAYGADLGYPRYFFIDEYGIIKHVFPAESFTKGASPYNAISDILSKI